MPRRNLTARDIILTALLIGLAPALARAAEGKVNPKAKTRTTFDDHIVPLFQTKCFGCHNPDRRKGGLALSTYALAFEGGSSGAVIKPGDVDGSRLWLLIDHQEEPHMPPRGGKLSDADLTVVRKWIEEGAAENKSSKIRLPDKPKLDLAASANPNARPEGPAPMPRGLSLDPLTRSTRATAVTALASNPWSPLIALSGQRQVLLYDASTGDLAGVLPFPEGIPHVLKFSRNGALLLAGGGRAAHSGRVVLWDVRTGERLTVVGSEFDTILAADITADHEYIALAGPSKMIRIYRTADGELIREIKKHTDWVYALEFSPDGVLLATADRSGGLHVWETFSGREYLDLRGHSGPITDLSWRLDSNILASCGEDRTVRLWELENGSTVKRWNAHGGGTLSIDFSRDGTLVTTGRDRLTRLWDQSGKNLRDFEPFQDIALESTYVSEVDHVVAGDWHGEVRLWNAKDGKRIADIATNPVELDTRLDAVRQALAKIRTVHDDLAKRVEASRVAVERAKGELASARSAIPTTEKDKDAARSQLTKIVSAVDSTNEQLQKSLRSLKEAEISHAEVVARKETDAEAIRVEREALERLMKSAQAHAVSVADSIRERNKTATRLLDLENKLRDLTAAAQRSAALLESESTKLPSDEKQLVAIGAQLATAESDVVRWTAAIGVRDARGDLTKEREAHRKLETDLTVKTVERDQLAADLAQLTKSLADSTGALQRAAIAARDAADKLSQATDASQSKAAELVRSLESDQGVPADRIATLKAAVVRLDESVQLASTVWTSAQESVRSANQTSEQNLVDFETKAAALAAANKAVAELTAKRQAALERVEIARKAWSEWTTKYETASRDRATRSKDLASK